MVISVVTEITEIWKLNPTVQDFVLHWGEMSNRWGINRSVAQIHALLYISEQPLRADEIGEALVTRPIQCEYEPQRAPGLGAREGRAPSG